MQSGILLLLAFGIGLVAGLRSLTAPALVAWASHVGWIHLSGSPLAFMSSTSVVVIFVLMALAELVADLFPSIPARISALGLSARFVTGALSGACLAVAGASVLWLGAITGAIGAIAGAFAGYSVRVGLVRRLNVRDFAIAIPEDIIAIGFGAFLISRF